MLIRKERPGEEKAIATVVEAAFGQPDEAALVEALRHSGDTVLSLVAVNGEKIAGHILFSKLHSPEGCLALAPVAVTPECQKKGIGSALIIDGLERARQAGWKAVFVLGEPDYYTRFGFSVELAQKFTTPYPKEYFMAAELQAGALDACETSIRYAAPFDAPG